VNKLSNKVAQPRSFWTRHARQILGVALLAFAVHDVFGAHGFLAMRQTRKEIEQLRSDIARLNEENGALAGQVKSLKNDPKTIERFARDMGMAKPGEIIFKLPPTAATAPSSPSKRP
jgi:cell division protein FtsB